MNRLVDNLKSFCCLRSIHTIAYGSVLALAAMREVGIDMSSNRTQAVLDLVKAGRLYAHVVTVCDEASAQRCPIFAGVTRREHWSFPDPAAFTGSDEERLDQTRRVRDAIRARIEDWVRGLNNERAPK